MAVNDRSHYESIARDQPNEVQLGGALITMVEPLPGRAASYNRWYEDDHFYAGAMMGPWVFAGRRFVAPRALRQAAIVGDPAAPSPRTGSYISLYWHTAGHLADVEAWAIEMLSGALVPAGRGSDERRHVYTAFHQLAFEVVLDPAPMSPVHALDHPYAGLVVELIDAAEGVSRESLLAWLKQELVPATAGKAGVAGQCLAFQPAPFRSNLAGEYAPWARDRDPAGRVCLLWFLHEEASGFFPGQYAEHQSLLRAAGVGDMALVAPYVPTVPGTDRYVDEL